MFTVDEHKFTVHEHMFADDEHKFKEYKYKIVCGEFRFAGTSSNII